MIKRLNRGDVVTVLERRNGYSYIREGENIVKRPLILHPSNNEVDAEEYICDVVSECDVMLDEKQCIVDDTPFVYPLIIGGRPSNIVRR